MISRSTAEHRAGPMVQLEVVLHVVAGFGHEGIGHGGREDHQRRVPIDLIEHNLAVDHHRAYQMLCDPKRRLHRGGAELALASLRNVVEVHRHRLADVPARQFLGSYCADELVGLARIGHTTFNDG